MTIQLSEYAQKAIASFTQRKEQHLQKIQHTAQLEQQARELEDRIDTLSEQLRQARADHSEARQNYQHNADMLAVKVPDKAGI